MRDRRRAKGKLVGSVGDVKVVVISMEHHLRNDRTRETRAIDEEDEEVRSSLVYLGVLDITMDIKTRVSNQLRYESTLSDPKRIVEETLMRDTPREN